jgi:hypothetical protein
MTPQEQTAADVARLVGNMNRPREERQAEREIPDPPMTEATRAALVALKLDPGMAGIRDAWDLRKRGSR